MNRSDLDMIYDLLNCEVDDIRYIRDCKYNIRELVKRVYYETGKPVSFRDICNQIFRRGLIDLHNIQYEKYIDLQKKHDPRAHCVGKLLSFKDIAYETHSKSPYIYFVKNEDDWRAYFNKDIERVEDEMGFRIGHSGEFIKGQEALAEEQRDAMTDVLG